MSDSAQERRTWHNDAALREAVRDALVHAMPDLECGFIDEPTEVIIGAVEDWHTLRQHVPDALGDRCAECAGMWPCKTARDLTDDDTPQTDGA